MVGTLSVIALSWALPSGTIYYFPGQGFSPTFSWRSALSLLVLWHLVLWHLVQKTAILVQPSMAFLTKSYHCQILLLARFIAPWYFFMAEKGVPYE